MMDDCEASNARILESLNTTLHTLNTTGLSSLHVEWLKGNTTNNITSGLQKCDLETFLTDVRVDVHPRGDTPRKIGWGCAAHFPKPLPYHLTLFMTKICDIPYSIYDLTKTFETLYL